MIKIDLGNAPNITSQVDSPFAALDGIALQGQTLSLDFSFLNGKFVRVFSVTSNTFDVQITLQTSGGGQVGFLDGTGYLIDSQGTAIPGFGITGGASGNNLLSIGLFPLLKDNSGTPNNDLPRPLDFFGVHFDLILPNNPSVAITSSDFTLLSDPGAPFGIGPGVPRDITTPETGSPLFLLCLSSLALMLVRMRVVRAS